ncbi:MAG: intermembrane transport protein PqiB [Idiomarina sp.]|nr:intermembrane transport protein PqiB [Idiomarina sp.]
MNNSLDDALDNTFGKARRGRARRISSIWLVPAVALAIGVWMAYDTISSRGALITLSMRNAEGLEAGQTLVKVKEVAVGRVESVNLSADFTHAEASIRMFDGTDNMLTDDARFWVVKPRIGRDGISGLSTLLSGAYIEMQPGSGEAGRREYATLAQPPVVRDNEEGVSLIIYGAEANQLTAGDPVTFRGYTVGRIEQVEFDVNEQRNSFNIFVQEPFAALVTDDVRFWQNSGVSMQLGADGLRLDIGSLESVLAGGITFDILNDATFGEPVADGTEFRLFRDRDAAQQEGFLYYTNYILLVEQSVRGLSAGAPVEFRGIRIGTVMQVPYTGGENLGRSLMERTVPVLIRMEPERLGSRYGGLDMDAWQAQLSAMFERGLRATLQSGNILTGSLFVDLVFTDAQGDGLVAHEYDYPLFPMQTGGSGSLEQRVAALVDNLNQLDFAALGDNASRTLAASEEALQTMEALGSRMTAILDDPAMAGLPARLQSTLSELERMLSGYSTDAPAYNDASRAIQRLEQILQDLEPFAESLGEQPNSLFFNRAAPPDPEPRRSGRGGSN